MKEERYPILDFDANPKSLLMPDHENLNLDLPEKLVFAFLYDEAEKYAKKYDCRCLGEFVCCTKTFPVYETFIKEERIAFCQAPLGASAATQFLDWCLAYGVKKVLATGSCGSLVSLAENVFLLPYRALRAEGTSYHYVKPSRYIDLKEEILERLEAGLEEEGLLAKRVMTWTTDAFFRETKDMVEARLAEGCEVVEMECAAMAACCELRGADFGQLLYTGDSLANLEKYAARSFGKDAREAALELCFRLISKF